ncbi:MAG: YraN family protein [Spirochaetaceae bacterium]
MSTATTKDRSSIWRRNASYSLLRPSTRKSSPPRKLTTTSNTEKGRGGEADAAAYLEQHGYRILQKNFRTPQGEVDIVAVQDDSVVFIEVKTWDRVPYEEVGLALSSRRRRRLRTASLEYLRRYPVFRSYARRFELLFMSSAGQCVRHVDVAVGK